MADYKGLTIKFEGDATDLSAALHTISERARAAEGELTGINRALKFDSRSPQVLGQKVRESTNHINTLKQRVDALRQGWNDADEKLGSARQKLSDLTNTLGEDADATKEAAEEVEHLERAQADAEDEIQRLNAQINGETDQLKVLKDQLSVVGDGLYDFGERAETAGGMLTGVGNAIKPIATKLTALSALTTRFLGRKILNQTEEFGNAMSQVGVYLGVAGDDLEHMSDLALFWGKETRYSATEAAQAMSELAKAGLTPVEIEAGAMKATMDLAAAGQLDLADSALTVAQSMRAFGLQAGNTTEIADALAGVANGTTSTVEGLANGFRYVAGWSRLSSWDIHEVSGALGLLADYGLQGEMAGTALRNVLMRLAAPTDKAKKVMEQYGIEVRDSNGQMKSAVDIIDELNQAFDGITEEERDAALNTMFGARGINAASALMDAGSQSLQEYIDMTNQSDAATEMAKGQLGDLGWALELLRGEAETAAVNVGESLTPMLIDIAEYAENALSAFNELDDAGRGEIVGNFMKLLAVGPALMGISTALKGLGAFSTTLGRASKFVSLFSAISSSAGSGVSLAERLGRAMTALGGDATKLGSNIMSAEVALTSLKIAAGVALVAVVALGAYEIWKQYDNARKRTEKLEAAMTGLTDACADSGQAVQNLGEDMEDAHRSTSELKDDIEELADTHIDLADTIRNSNRQLSHNTSQLSDARDTVIEYLDDVQSGTRLSAEQQGELTAALQTLETQYGITFDTVEGRLVVYDDEGEAIDLTKDKIYELCDAKLYEMQLNAYQSRYQDLYAQQLEEEEARAKAVREVADAQAEVNRLRGLTPEQRIEEFGSEAAYQGALNAAVGNLGEYRDRLAEIDGLLGDLNASLDDTEYEMGAVAAAASGEDLSLGQWAALDDRIKGSLYGHLAEFGVALDDVGIDAEKMKGILQGLSDDQLMRLSSQFDGSAESIRNSLAVMTGDASLFTDGWKSAIDLVAQNTGASTDEIIAAIVSGIEDGSIEVGEAGGSLYQTLIGHFDPKGAQDAGGELAKSIAKGAFDEVNRNHFLNDVGPTIAENVQNTFDRAWHSTKSFDRHGIDAANETVTGYINGLKDRRAQSQVQKAAGETAQSAGSGFSQAAKRIDLSGVGSSLMASFRNGMSAVDVSSTASTKAYQVKNNLKGNSWTWGFDLVKNFAAGMDSYNISSTASKVASKIAAFLKHSTPERGPLSDDDVWGLHLGQNLASGMYDAIPSVERASLEMAEAVQQPTLELGYDEGSFYTGIADSVNMNRNVNIYFNGNRVNDNPAMRSAFLDLMYEASRYSNMNGRRG